MTHQQQIFELYFDRLIGVCRLIGWLAIGACIYIGLGAWFTFIYASLSFLLVMAAANFLSRIYSFANQGAAFQYLLMLLFGFRFKGLALDLSRAKDADPNALDFDLPDPLMAPGFIRVTPGDAMLVETPEPSKYTTCLTGEFFLKPLDILRGVMSPPVIKDKIDKITATTKDGIPVCVQDIHYLVRVLSDQEIQLEGKGSPPNNVQATYEQAMSRWIYRHIVRRSPDTGVLPPQDFRLGIKMVIERVIKEYIISHQVDQVTMPRVSKNGPRLGIMQSLLYRENERSFSGMGVRLLWVDPGCFSLLDANAAQQRIQTWKTDWIGKARVIEAHGEAHRLANQERGRAEAQSELLNGLLNSLQDINPSEDLDQNLRNVILVRTAQILEAMTSINQDSDKDRR